MAGRRTRSCARTVSISTARTRTRSRRSQDGRSLLFGSDAAANAREIAAFDPRDVAGFAAYGERTERAGRALFDSFSDEEPRFDRFDAETQALLRGSAAELVETLRVDAGACKPNSPTTG